jgi:hypothetical protein
MTAITDFTEYTENILFIHSKPRDDFVPETAVINPIDVHEDSLNPSAVDIALCELYPEKYFPAEFCSPLGFTKLQSIKYSPLLKR